MFHSRPRSPGYPARRWTSLAVVGAAVAALLAAPSAASAEVPTISIADTGADAHTRSLFRFLSEVSGTGVLFGQQHAIDESISPTATGPDGQPVSSDSYTTTGHLPGLFGFDTLALMGGEKPGAAGNTLSQNADLLGQAFVRADALGAVVTLSAHMPNFVTGGNFNDTSGGDVISHILPGGDRNADFTAYLDGVARAATGAVRADGSLVPVVFRPFHENTGSWFWWGTANSSAETYKEAFRYTVEYLRDVKGVHNLLYAYSPNGSLDANPARYLATYPGDQWVDVMGYDYYQTDPSEAGTQTWLDQLVGDLGMISRLAQAHGKIPALTEFGRGGAATVTESGNTGLQYFTRLLQAIRADSDAARIAYMQTWANFSASTVYVPPTGHDLAPDFIAYESDSRTLFAGEAMSRFDLPATAGAQEPTVRLMTPSSGSRVASSPVIVRAKVSGIDPAEVASVRFWSDDQNSAAQDLVFDPEQGLWMGTWGIDPSALDNSTLALHVVAATSAGDLAWDGQIIAGTAPVFGAGVVDDFDSYGDDTALRTAYAVNNTTPDAISLADRDDGGALRLSYDLGPGGYLGVGKSFDPRADWSAFAGLSLFLDSDGSGQKLVLQITTTDGVFEANPSLATDVAGSVTVPWAQWVPAAWDTAHAGAALTPQRLASITGFWIYVNDVDGASAHTGSIVLDDIRATGTGEPSVPGAASTSIDDFESYTDDEALRGTWGNRGKTSLLTVSSEARTGERAMKISYEADRDGSWIDVSRSLSGGWPDADGLRLAVRGDGSTATLAIQVGTSQGRYWIATVALSDSAWQDVKLPWSSFTGSWPVGLSDPLAASDLADVTELVLAVSNAPAGSVGQVTVDDIALMTQAAPTEPGTPAEPGVPVDPGSPAGPGAPGDPGAHGDPGTPAGDGANASAGDGTGVDNPAGSSLARTGAPDTALLSVWGLALLLLGAMGAWRVRMRRA